MVTYIVMWRLKDEAVGATKAENGQKMKEMLEGLKGRVREIRHIEVGINALESPDAFDVALVSEFATWQDLDVYREHPEHKKVAEFVAQVRLERKVVDYQT